MINLHELVKLKWRISFLGSVKGLTTAKPYDLNELLGFRNRKYKYIQTPTQTFVSVCICTEVAWRNSYGFPFSLSFSFSFFFLFFFSFWVKDPRDCLSLWKQSLISGKCTVCLCVHNASLSAWELQQMGEVCMDFTGNRITWAHNWSIWRKKMTVL